MKIYFRGKYKNMHNVRIGLQLHPQNKYSLCLFPHCLNLRSLVRFDSFFYKTNASLSQALAGEPRLSGKAHRFPTLCAALNFITKTQLQLIGMDLF